MSKGNPKKGELPRKDDGYPFDTGDWAKWANVKRLNWIRNFRDRLHEPNSRTYYKRYGLTDEQMAKIEADTETMEKLVAKELAAMKINEAAMKSVLPDIDDSALRSAFASGDEAAVNREFRKWIAKLEERADRDSVFAEWFENFRTDQERLLRWDDVIGDEE